MKFRFWATVITFVLIAFVVFFGWDQMVQAWNIMGSVNLLIFALILPVQFISYYAVGEVMFSYLRSKGNLTTISRWRMTRIALELNFVNHIIPVPSIAGFSYLSWILNRHGVSAGRATMAQIIRLMIMFITFVVIMVISVVFLIFDHNVNRLTIIICASFVVATVAGTAFLIYVIGSRKRLTSLSNWLINTVNKIVSKFTRGKKRQVLKLESVEKFFVDLHQDYLEIRSDKKILAQPIMWGFIANILDVGLISIAFLALGYWVSPATLFVAFGVSSIVAVFVATPGGSGAYEAVMIAFLVSAGVPAEIAIAGTLLARATLFTATILFGYIFYQLTISKYGKFTDKPANI